MEDFLSVENYQLISNYLINFSQKKFNININVNDYDEKIYLLMEQIYDKFNPNLSKTKANMFVIKNILDTIKEDVFKLNFQTEKQITMNEMIQNENKKSEKINKNIPNQIPVSISDDINQKISRQLETRQIYNHIRIKNDIDPLKMYKKLNIEKQNQLKKLFYDRKYSLLIKEAIKLNKNRTKYHKNIEVF